LKKGVRGIGKNARYYVNVKETIMERRAYRSLQAVEITNELIAELGKSAGLAPSCFNKQPWRFVFVDDKVVLGKLFTAMSKGNEWTFDASMVIAVFSEKKLDCVIKERYYYLFDTGMAVAFLMLRATELGLVAHPIAGYDEEKAKSILNIPTGMRLITLVIIGEHSRETKPVLSEQQAEAEGERPPRLAFDKFAYRNSYNQ